MSKLTTRFQDLTGQKFGMLTVKNYIGKGGTNGRKHLWYCECDCGGNKIVDTSSLRSEAIKSCGCMHRDKLLGLTYNRLTVVGKLDELDKKNNQQWICKCSCGNPNEIIATTYDLKSGKTKSCGCLHIENGRNAGLSNKKYNTYDLTGEYGIGYTLNTDEQFYFDLDEFDKIKNYCWSKDGGGYIRSFDSIRKKGIKLHRLIYK